MHTAARMDGDTLLHKVYYYQYDFAEYPELGERGVCALFKDKYCNFLTAVCLFY
jgi:hypothetical protein